jgi:hypothetical protein
MQLTCSKHDRSLPEMRVTAKYRRWRHFSSVLAPIRRKIPEFLSVVLV